MSGYQTSRGQQRDGGIKAVAARKRINLDVDKKHVDKNT